jgi:glycosyltransferase involved in cell wall biosynthesis
MKYSIVIPVYRNEGSIEPLVESLTRIAEVRAGLEVVFVVDGSPDASHAKLRELLPAAPFESQLLLLSRNFGSFPAITAGLTVATGNYIAIIAADLQEPANLPVEFFDAMESGDCDVVIGQRVSRSDPWTSRLASGLFWALYRGLVQRDLPPGGIDVFGCTSQVRDVLVRFTEVNTSLVGLLLWVGFRRRVVHYQRLARQHGKSAWSLRRKIRYLKDSVFAFSDLPIRMLGWAGSLGMLVAVVFAIIILVGKLLGGIAVPGYAATVVAITFFGGLNSLGLSLIGEYIWRNFENSKQRPRFVVFGREQMAGAPRPAGAAGVEHGRILQASVSDR